MAKTQEAPESAPESPGGLPDPADFLSGNVSQDGVMPDLPNPDLPRLTIKETPEDAKPDTETPPSREAEEVQSRIEKLEKELERAEKRRADTERSYHERNQEAILERKANELIERRLQAERLAMKRAGELEFPSVEDPDQLLDGERLQDHLRKSFGVLEARIGAAIKPYFDTFGTANQMTQALVETAKKSAMDQAKSMVQSDGFDDFDEMRPKIEEHLSQMDGSDVLQVNPEAIRDTYLLIRARAGKPMRAPGGTTPPVVTSPRSPQQTSADRSERIRKIKDGYGGALEAVLPQLGIEELDLTDEENLRILEKGLRT